MSLITKYLICFSLMLFGSSVWAGCSYGGAPTVQLDMVMGRVIVDPELPVGAVIAKRDWTMSGGNAVNYYCTDINRFKAEIVAPGVNDLGNKVFSTNVEGIGMRFSRGGGTINMIYPDYLSSNGRRGTYYTLEGSRFTLELIKTASVTGSGSVTAGQYTTYDWEFGQNPILETFLSADAITIV